MSKGKQIFSIGMEERPARVKRAFEADGHNPAAAGGNSYWGTKNVHARAASAKWDPAAVFLAATIGSTLPGR